MELKVDLKKEMDELRMFIRQEIAKLANSRQNGKSTSVKKDHSESGQSTVDQVARDYKVSRLTVYNWVKKNKLKTTKMGRNLMINEADLARFFEKNARIRKRLSNKKSPGKRKVGRPKKK